MRGDSANADLGFGLCGEINAERCAFADDAVEFDLPEMVFHNLVANRKTEACAALSLFSGKIRVEDSV